MQTLLFFHSPFCFYLPAHPAQYCRSHKSEVKRSSQTELSLRGLYIPQVTEVVSVCLVCRLPLNLSSGGICCAQGFNRASQLVHINYPTLEGSTLFFFIIMPSDSLSLEQWKQLKELSTPLNLKVVLEGRK